MKAWNSIKNRKSFSCVVLGSFFASSVSGAFTSAAQEDRQAVAESLKINQSTSKPEEGREVDYENNSAQTTEQSTAEVTTIQENETNKISASNLDDDDARKSLNEEEHNDGSLNEINTSKENFQADQEKKQVADQNLAIADGEKGDGNNANRITEKIASDETNVEEFIEEKAENDTNKTPASNLDDGTRETLNEEDHNDGSLNEINTSKENFQADQEKEQVADQNLAMADGEKEDGSNTPQNTENTENTAQSNIIETDIQKNNGEKVERNTGTNKTKNDANNEKNTQNLVTNVDKAINVKPDHKKTSGGHLRSDYGKNSSKTRSTNIFKALFSGQFVISSAIAGLACRFFKENRSLQEDNEKFVKDLESKDAQISTLQYLLKENINLEKGMEDRIKILKQQFSSYTEENNMLKKENNMLYKSVVMRRKELKALTSKIKQLENLSEKLKDK